MYNRFTRAAPIMLYILAAFTYIILKLLFPINLAM